MLKSIRFILPSLFKSTLAGGVPPFLYQYAMIEKSTRFTLPSQLMSPTNDPQVLATLATSSSPTMNDTGSVSALTRSVSIACDWALCVPSSSGVVSKLYKYAPLALAVVVTKCASSECTAIFTVLFGTENPNIASLSPCFTSLLSTSMVGARMMPPILTVAPAVMETGNEKLTE